jgi:hypothetical protein
LWSEPDFSCCWTPPLQAHWGRWCHTRLLRLACLFTVCVRECPSPVELSTGQPLLQAFPAPNLLGRGHHSCLLWPACLFTVLMCERPSPLSGALGAGPSLLYVFFVSAACLLFSFGVFKKFFPWVGVSLSRGLADLSQGVLRAAYLLTWWSPKQGRSWRLVVQEHSWFLHLMWSGDAVCGLGVWRCWSFASSWWFFLLGVSTASLQEFTLGSTLSASSL